MFLDGQINWIINKPQDSSLQLPNVVGSVIESWRLRLERKQIRSSCNKLCKFNINTFSHDFLCQSESKTSASAGYDHVSSWDGIEKFGAHLKLVFNSFKNYWKPFRCSAFFPRKIFQHSATNATATKTEANGWRPVILVIMSMSFTVWNRMWKGQNENRLVSPKNKERRKSAAAQDALKLSAFILIYN